ncbi:hypothetical protein NEUTE1DRAFT_116546 [Neurospora tetrasperma FGSC 2508]|uniref:Uncharacterized protein n=1 Tax=Neurospora tetrasperma (strain FGSC 2508 / ATCC MYA-4615 / P0657) TaxID=510951 RepID=F8MGU4_NEUT8|nr:uncharacterized protein NEUTE1DRAFT_116546 [Neurospora tetrasperma FGSC 2508]EGO59513.1 hypothetical protein NEUTE1DRAFT_116546 [Neurospora tetrasperma FGSC 2508]EGZ73642.1 hypothetical protein NEUTE2DRAFT_144241 [Neurospora tetrasperma FGSC 2509]
MRRPKRIRNHNLPSRTYVLNGGNSLRDLLSHPPYPRHQSQTRDNGAGADAIRQ